MQTLEIQGFSYQERQAVLPGLTSGFAECGGWVLERKTLSPAMIVYRMEIQLGGIVELYAAMIAAGLELTRSAHLALTELCTCRRHSRSRADLGQVISVRLEITFLEEVTLHSLLSTTMAPV